MVNQTKVPPGADQGTIPVVLYQPQTAYASGKEEAAQEYQQLSIKKQVYSFLGLAEYYRHFNFFSIVALFQISQGKVSRPSPGEWTVPFQHSPNFVDSQEAHWLQDGAEKAHEKSHSQSEQHYMLFTLLEKKREQHGVQCPRKGKREAATNGEITDLEEYTPSLTNYIGKCIDDVTVFKSITR
ncbi:hypothetical protein QTP86_000685 [Hemibagrus guttatus]|nr:hypothetical protein QTP86_000685 [Hemibagrus guttatus]